jgi:hypothetical protein
MDHISGTGDDLDALADRVATAILEHFKNH